MKKKILVDLSMTLIHHGHIRLLKKASRFGHLIIALTSDKEIIKYKGYKPELNFYQRKEILSSIKYVKKIIKSKWKIDDNFLKKYNINLLIRGDDYKNEKFNVPVKIFKRTKNISSTILRKRVFKILKKNEKQ